MNQLGTIDLREIAASEQPKPELSPCSPWLDQISCPICGTFKLNAMVIHQNCMRMICASCALSTIELSENKQQSPCGLCRGPLRELGNETGQTLYFTLPPNDVWLMEHIEYQCRDCLQKMLFSDAKTHPNVCKKRKQYKPPDYIHQWDDVDIVRRPTVSNPTIGEPAKGKDRLLLYHHNGLQLDSKFVNANWNVARVKLQIARITGTDSNEVRLFKFYHEELNDDTLVRDIAPKLGTTHITSLSGMQDLKSRTALISFHDIGPAPHVPKPKKPRV